MIIVVGGIKGGGGKTTLATNLIVMRALQGKKLLLVDTDEQKSATHWAEQRVGRAYDSWVTIALNGKSVHLQIAKLKKDYDDIIIDAGGYDSQSQRSSLLHANCFLIPFRPRSFDIWTIGKVKELIQEIKIINPYLKCITVINQADHIGKDNEIALEILSECGEVQCLPVVIGNRKVFPNAASDGLSVVELNDQKAKKELQTLHDMIFNVE